MSFSRKGGCDRASGPEAARWIVRAALLTCLLLPPTQAEMMAGDTPSYISAATCPPPVQQVIQMKQVNPTQIHRCHAEAMTADGQTVHWVELEYGKAQDCPSGCFYTRWSGVVEAGSPPLLTELPDRRVASQQMASKVYPSRDGKTNLRCAEAEDAFDLTLARYQKTLAWKGTLRHPIRCTWDGGAQSISGSIFATLDHGTTRLHTEKLLVR